MRQSHRRSALGLTLGPIAELLAADAGLVHQTALDQGKDRHALLVAALPRSLVPADVRAGAGPAGRGLRCCAGGDCDRLGLRAKLEPAGGEFLEGALVLEEDDLAEGFAPE